MNKLNNNKSSTPRDDPRSDYDMRRFYQDEIIERHRQEDIDLHNEEDAQQQYDLESGFYDPNAWGSD